MKLFILILTILQACLYAKQRVAPYSETVEVKPGGGLSGRGDGIFTKYRKIGIQREYGPEVYSSKIASEHQLKPFYVYTTEEIYQLHTDLYSEILKDVRRTFITITAPNRNHGDSFSDNQLPEENASATLWDFIKPIQRNWEYVCQNIQNNEKAINNLDKRFSNTIIDLASAIQAEITPLIQEDIKNNVVFREAITSAAMQKLLETILKLEERVKQLESEQ